jgi:hypothetical protein
MNFSKVFDKVSHSLLTHKLDHYGIKRKPTSGSNISEQNDPYLVQAFLKKWWVESDFKAPNLPLSLQKLIFRYQDLVEIYSVSAETIISDAFSDSENV